MDVKEMKEKYQATKHINKILKDTAITFNAKHDINVLNAIAVRLSIIRDEVKELNKTRYD